VCLSRTSGNESFTGASLLSDMELFVTVDDACALSNTSRRSDADIIGIDSFAKDQPQTSLHTTNHQIFLNFEAIQSGMSLNNT
jgi:hypothetical protein